MLQRKRARLIAGMLAFFFGCAAASPDTEQRVLNGWPARLCEPAFIFVEDAEGEPKLQKAVDQAAVYWNQTLGFPIFYGVTVREGADVIVSHNDIIKPYAIVMSRHLKGCMKSLLVIVTAEAIAQKEAVLLSIMRHEFGHVLGLADCPLEECGLMRKHIRKLEPGHPKGVTPQELQLVRRIYGREPEAAGGEVLAVPPAKVLNGSCVCTDAAASAHGNCRGAR